MTDLPSDDLDAMRRKQVARLSVSLGKQLLAVAKERARQEQEVMRLADGNVDMCAVVDGFAMGLDRLLRDAWPDVEARTVAYDRFQAILAGAKTRWSS